MPSKFSEVQTVCLAIAGTPLVTSAQRTVAMHEEQRGTALPFAIESTDPYAGRSKAKQRQVANAVGKAKDAGASGDELRAIFGALLSGPARRRILREHGAADGRIAPSYDAYRDGDLRSGSRHAREHGAEAVARREAEAKAEAAKQRRAERAAERKAAREAAASTAQQVETSDAS